MAQVVGLDIGTRTITGAVFTGTEKKFKLTDFFVEEIPSIDAATAASVAGGEIVTPPSLPEVLQRIFDGRNLRGLDVVAGLDTKDAIIREVPVPFVKDEHIRKTIHSEAETHFQTFDIEEAVLEYLKVEEMGDKSRVVLVAVRDGVIKDRLDTLKAAAIDPVALDLDAAALFNAFARTPTFDPGRTTLLLDMGATSTKAILVEKGQPKKIRSIRMDSYFARPGNRLLPEPGAAAALGASGGPTANRGTAGRGAAGCTSVGEVFPFSDSYSIEARFAEIENALRRLEPIAGEGAGGISLGDEPIAILTDEEFDLVSEDAGPAVATEAPPPLPELHLPDSHLPELQRADGRSNGIPPSSGAFSGPGNGAGNGNGAGAPQPELNYGDYLERLGIELQRTFSTVGSEIELICLTGGMGQREEARRYFAAEFDVETIHLDFGDSFPMSLPPDAQAKVGQVGAVAVGLGLKALGVDRVGFDFRKKQFRYEHKFERLKYPLLAVAVLTFCVFAQLVVNFYFEWDRYQWRIDEIRRREVEEFEAFFGTKNSSQLLVPQANTMKKNWEASMGKGGAGIPYFVDVVKALVEVAKAIQESKANVRIDTIDFKMRTKPQQRGGIAAEAASTVTLTTSEGLIGTRLEKLFGKPGGVFNCSASDHPAAGGTNKVTLTLNPQQKYLDDLRK